MKQPLKHLQLGFSSLTYFVNGEKKKQIRRNGPAVKFRDREIDRDATPSAISYFRVTGRRCDAAPMMLWKSKVPGKKIVAALFSVLDKSSK